MSDRDDDERLSCGCCGDDADGTSECPNCGTILCPDCETMYEDCCTLCYEDFHAEDEDDA